MRETLSTRAKPKERRMFEKKKKKRNEEHKRKNNCKTILETSFLIFHFTPDLPIYHFLVKLAFNNE